MLFPKKTNAETSTFTDALNAIASELGNTTPGTPEYDKLLEQAKNVQELISKNPPFSFKPDANTILTSGVTLILAVVTIKHEAFNVITSKAWGLLPKLIH